MNIASHIGQLVSEHECVIIPGLGAFLSNYHAAEINLWQHSIQPPTKKLVFNAQLKTNDGLLAHHLALKLDVSYKSAIELLEMFTAYCWRDLADGKQIAFGHLGILDLNQHDKLEFFPNNEINYNSDAFGLKDLSLKTIDRSIDFNAKVPVQQVSKKPRTAKVIALRPVMARKIAAILIPIALVFGAAFFLPKIVKNTTVQQTSFFNFLENLKFSLFQNDDLSKETIISKTVTAQKVENANTEPINTNISETAEISSQEEVVESVEAAVQIQEIENISGNYHIICGSFVEKERALAFIDQLKTEGYSAYIAGKSNSGTFRVSMQSFANLDDANRQIKQIRYKGYDRAWILNKQF
jgi:cell division septation protein DedD